MPFDTLRKFGKGGVNIDYKEEPIQPQVYEILSNIIKKRRSVRKYLQKDVPDEILQKVLDSTRYTPSAGNYQPWEFIVVKNPDMKKDLATASFNQNWMLEAPVFIIACVNVRLAGAVYGERGSRLYGVQAVAAAIENILLTAESLDLGTCWVGAFSEVVVARMLECPEYVRPCAIITLGYPAEEPTVPPKQSTQEYIHIEKFGQTLLTKNVSEEKKPTYMKFR